RPTSKGGLPLSDLEVDDLAEVRRCVPTCYACNPRTCTSSHPDAAFGSRRPSLARGDLRKARGAPAARARFPCRLSSITCPQPSARHCNPLLTPLAHRGRGARWHARADGASTRACI